MVFCLEGGGVFTAGLQHDLEDTPQDTKYDLARVKKTTNMDDILHAELKRANKLSKNNELSAFLQRQPFVIIGAFGLIAIVDGFSNLPGYIGQWTDAWQAITRPIWEFLFGWLFSYFNVAMPWWLKDYFSMGLIAAGMEVRSTIYDWRFNNGYKSEYPLKTRTPLYRVYVYSKSDQIYKFYFLAIPLIAIDDFLRWPIRIVQVLLRYVGITNPGYPHPQTNEPDLEWRKHKKDANRIYFETVLYALILIAFAYAMTQW